MSTILIVDDNEQNRYLLRTLLAAADHVVLEATHGVEALELARRARPALIISDILMPQMDGFALCRECKRDETLRDIPFVFYTATYTDPRDEALALQLGAARFIVKPVENNEFIAILRQVLQAHQAGQLVAPQPPLEEETVFYRLYNEALIRKLEDKLLQLEEANRTLERELAERRQAEERLFISEAQLRATLYSIGDAVIATDREGRVTMMNPVSEKLTGWMETEALGEPLEEVFHIVNEETRTAVENPVQRVLREGVVIGLANHTLLIARDGREYPIADAGAPIRDAKDEIVGVVLVFRDQTAQRAAQRAVQEARQFAEGIVETLREPLVVLDAELRVVSANRAFYRTFQTTPEETERRLIYNLGNRQWDIPELRRLLEDILPQNTQFNDYEVRHNFEHIGEHVMLLNARRIYREANKTQLILLAIEDITQRKQAEESLQEMSQTLQAVIQASPLPIFALDREGNVTLWNPAAERAFGWSEHQVLGGQNPAVPEDRMDESQAMFLRVLGGNGFAGVETQRQRKDGSLVDVSISTAPLRDRHGNASGVMAVIADITERKRAEAQLAEQLNELRRWYTATLGREERVLELKREVNELLTQRGQPPRYPSAAERP